MQSSLCMQMVAKAQVSNYLVVAIDAQLHDDLTAKGYNVYYKDISVSLSSTFMSSSSAVCIIELCHIGCRALQC